MSTPERFRAVDASMDLLKVLRETALDPEYRTVPGSGRWSGRLLAVLVFALAGALLGTAALQTTKSRPEAERERAVLIGHIKQAQRTDTELRRQLAQLGEEQRRLQAAQLGESSQSVIDETGALTGAVAVTGPGIVVVVDDAHDLSGQASPQQQVADTDLRRLVNALWQAGAEAIAVNGHRISARTAIRSAGTAITVDYVSLVPPYTVSAIGDPKSLPARLNETEGGHWWNGLKANYGLRYDVSTSDNLSLPADPGLSLTHARPPR